MVLPTGKKIHYNLQVGSTTREKHEIRVIKTKIKTSATKIER
jgi:hypothetical protein